MSQQLALQRPQRPGKKPSQTPRFEVRISRKDSYYSVVGSLPDIRWILGQEDVIQLSTVRTYIHDDPPPTMFERISADSILFLFGAFTN